jgi:hypothetical protein
MYTHIFIHTYIHIYPHREYSHNQGSYRGQDVPERDQNMYSDQYPRRDQNSNTEKDQNRYNSEVRRDQNLNTDKDQNRYNSEVQYTTIQPPYQQPQSQPPHKSNISAPNAYPDASAYSYPERPVYPDAPILNYLSAAPAVQVKYIYKYTYVYTIYIQICIYIYIYVYI